MSQSTIFQLCQDWSSFVEPVSTKLELMCLALKGTVNMFLKGYPSCSEVKYVLKMVSKRFSKTCVKQSLKNRQNTDLNNKW